MAHMHFSFLLILLSLSCLCFSYPTGGVVDVVSDKQKVTNGFRANETVAKSIAHIAYKESGDDEMFSLCTGIVVRRKKVLSAAHCFFSGDSPNVAGVEYYVYIGGTEEYSGTAYKVKKIATYKGYTNFPKGKDLAILTTETRFSNKVSKPAILVDSSYKLKHGSTLHVSGFGITRVGPVGDDADNGFLNQIPLRYLNGKVCSRRDPFTPGVYKPKDFICMINPNLPGMPGGACFGDSGGPLFRMENGRMVVYGVVSGGPSSCNGDISYFMKVRNYYDDIQNYLKGDDQSQWDLILSP